MNSRQTIMIVDDTEMNIAILVEELQGNYEVIVAINGLDAIELLKDQKPDLILLDIIMPEMDGYDVLKTIKKNSELEHIPVILLSAIKDSGSKTKGFSLGAVDYVTKPFEIIEVKARVKTQLRLEEARLVLESQNIVLEEEKAERAAELVVANIELAFQSKEKGRRAAELLIAKKELIFQNEEKADRAAELVIANIELAFQGKEKSKRAAEFTTEHQNRLFEKEMARLDRLYLVGQMAEGIGHEIRNPMTTVRGYLQLLGEKPEYAARKPTFDLMISELDGANAIITEFLSLTQTERTEVKFQNINDIVKNLYSFIKGATFTQNKQIRFIPGEIPNLELNPSEITQLVLNLTRNGLEAMPEGGCLKVKSYVEDGKVVLAITDEGCGIPPENLRKLGTPFFTTKDSGTGLDLAICYKIVESHNAKIEIDSSSSGTTFFISFPIPVASSGIGSIISALA